MKKITLALLVISLVVSVCLAQSVTVAPLFEKITEKTKIFVGVITSETLVIDPEEGSRDKITVVDNKGKEMVFVLWPPIVIQDEDAGPTINTIEKDDKVFVLYNITEDGLNDAEFIQTID